VRLFIYQGVLHWCEPWKVHSFNFYNKRVKCSPNLIIFGRQYSFTNVVCSDIKIPVLPVFCNYCISGNQNIIRLHFDSVSLCLTAISVSSKTNMLNKVNQYINMIIRNLQLMLSKCPRLAVRRKSESICFAIRHWLCRWQTATLWALATTQQQYGYTFWRESRNIFSILAGVPQHLFPIPSQREPRNTSFHPHGNYRGFRVIPVIPSPCRSILWGPALWTMHASINLCFNSLTRDYVL